MEFLTDLVESYLFDKSKDLLNQTTYHDIYCNEVLVVFKGKKIIQEIKDWLAEFQQILDKVAGNQHLQFSAEIGKNYKNLPPSEKKAKARTVENYEFPFLDMKIIWSSEKGLQFGVFNNYGQ